MLLKLQNDASLVSRMILYHVTMSSVFLISDVAEVAECGLSPVPPGLHRPGGPGCQRPRAHGHHHKGEVPPDPWLGADCLRGSFLKISFVFIVLFLKWGGGGFGN